MSEQALLEVHLYADGRKVALFGAPTRPAYLPSSDFVGLINQDPRPVTGDYAVDLSRFAVRAGVVKTLTWLAVYRGRPDPVLGDRGNYVGAGLWLPDNPLIALDQVIEALRHMVDRIVSTMDANPTQAQAQLNVQLPDYANGAIEWLRSHAIGGPTDPDLGLQGAEGAPRDAQRTTVRMRNVFGVDALATLSAAMIARTRAGMTRLLLLQDEQAATEPRVEERKRALESLFGVSAPLNALNHHAVNFSVGSAARERAAREAEQRAQAERAQAQADLGTVQEELELLRQTAERQRLDLQRADAALRNEKTAHEQTREQADEANRLRSELERAQADFQAYKVKVRNAGQSPELGDRLRAKVTQVMQPSPARSSSGSSRGGGARRVQRSGRDAAAFWDNNRLMLYVALAIIGALILGSMGVTYYRDQQRTKAAQSAPTIDPLPAPVPQQGVIDATADPNATLQQPAVVDPAAVAPSTTTP